MQYAEQEIWNMSKFVNPLHSVIRQLPHNKNNVHVWNYLSKTPSKLLIDYEHRNLLHIYSTFTVQKKCLNFVLGGFVNSHYAVVQTLTFLQEIIIAVSHSIMHKIIFSVENFSLAKL